MLHPDHLVVAASDLDSGTHWLEERLGVALAGGGQHLAMGTHNRLLRLGERFYLELIAIDPAQPMPARSRWFALDTPAMQARLSNGPQLIHWVAASDNIAQDALRAGFTTEDIRPMTRGDYRWRITVPADGHLPGNGLLPTLIQWDVPGHPAASLPANSCQLMKLEAFTPHADALRQTLNDLGLPAVIDLHPVQVDEPAEWIAYLKTPRGLVELLG